MAETRIGIVVFDGFTDVDVFLPWDLLNRVEAPGWSVVFLGDGASARSATGLEVPVHGPLQAAADCAAVLVASGKSTRERRHDEAFLERLRLDPERQLVCSIDSGALLLAAKGLLAGKRATTYPTAAALLSEYGVEVVEQAFVVDGNLATAAQCLATQHLSGWIIERLLGAEHSRRVLASVQPLGEDSAVVHRCDAA